MERSIRTRKEHRQGGSISVLLSNLYLHYVLDLWFERVVKSRLRGEARLVRYIDDFVICFQYRSDAIRVQDALRFRLGKFGLTLEPTKTKLVEFGRFAQRHAGKRGRKRPETIYFLGLMLYCTRNLKGNFKVGMRTEKSRLRRSLLSLQELTRRIRHHKISDQAGEKHVWRATIILATADGCGTAEIMRRSGKSKPVVWAWQARFMAEGVAGLFCGAPERCSGSSAAISYGSD